VLGIQPVIGRLISPRWITEVVDLKEQSSAMPTGSERLAGVLLLLAANSCCRATFPDIGVTPANFYGVEVGNSFDVAYRFVRRPVITGL